MEFVKHLPVWDKLTPSQQELLQKTCIAKNVEKGTVLHDGSPNCMGLLLIKSGQPRACILSEEGREVTLYRLFEYDICLLAASCVMKSVQFDVTITAEKDSELFIIPPHIFKRLTEESAPFSNYVNDLMAQRFSEVMWLMEQIMWKSFDKRLASFLLEETALEGSLQLHTTHEAIANHMGTAREVVTRMLRYFQTEGYVRLSRGVVEVTDEKALRKLQ